MDIPVIPGVSVTPMGILNKPLKDIICAILFGGLNNLLKGNLLCVNLDIEQLLGEPIMADLKAELTGLKDELKAFEDAMGIKDMIGRVNAAVAEAQNLLALDGLCKIPLKAPPIPDIIGQTIDMEYANANAILNDLGRLAKPKICLSGSGGINSGSYNADSILHNLQQHLKNAEKIPQTELNLLKNRLNGVSNALKKSVDRQLFPDFRHKTNLATGMSYTPADPHVVTLAPPPPVSNQWNPPYPPVSTPNLKDATSQAQILVASIKKTASYPATVNGIVHQNIWPGIVGPEVYSLAVQAMTPQDPLFVQQDPVYDYCGKLVGYTSTVITGDQNAKGGDPTNGADLNPPQTNFNFVWIADRNCWAVTGVQSQQVVNGKLDVYLDANPTITLHRGYNHILGIPSADINGFMMQDNSQAPTLTSMAPEFFICKVDKDLKPMIVNNEIVKFNMGLSRLETSELLDNANGWLPSEAGYAGIDGPEGYQRRLDNPFGTTMYFSIEQQQYEGTEPPPFPNADVWWYNPETCVAQKWVPNTDPISGLPDGTGTWTVVTDLERLDHWYGSSNIYNNPNVNYLAYSNKDGSVFGLFKLV